jgi:hypothetical protein
MGFKNMVRWLQPFALSVLLVISFSFKEEVSLEARCWPHLFKKVHPYQDDQYCRRRQEYIFLNCRKIYLIDPIFTKTMSNIKSKIKIEGASKPFFGHNLNMAKERLSNFISTQCPPILFGFSPLSNIHILLPIWRLIESCSLLEISCEERPPDSLRIYDAPQECARAPKAQNRPEI